MKKEKRTKMERINEARKMESEKGKGKKKKKKEN